MIKPEKFNGDRIKREDFFSRLNQIIDFLSTCVSRGDGVTTKVNNGVVSVINPASDSPLSPTASYTGPFAIVKKNDTTVTVTWNEPIENFDISGDWAGYIIIDMGTAAVLQRVIETDIALTGDFMGGGMFYICVDFWYDVTSDTLWKSVCVSSLDVAPHAEDYESYPASLLGVTRYVLGKVVLTDNKISGILQLHRGIINCKSRSY